ncbi:MAG: PHP domain-containing protein, partial [Clostridia bacterium]|nr:PHP domain-containing protein [Clostridia bacterium]
MKILSVEVYNKLKKFVLVFENDREFTQEEQLKIKQEWLKKLKTNGDIEIEIRVNVEEAHYEEAPIPEFAPPQDVSYDDNVVEIPFSVEQYEEAQKESIRLAAKNMRGASGSGYEGGSYHRKNGGEYTNKGDGKYSKKKKLTPDEGEELKKDSRGNTIYMGREIDSVISKMSEIDADSGYVAVSGKIFKYEDKQIPSGSYIAMIEMTDNTYSVVAKFFFDEFDLKFVQSTFKEGNYITVYGQASQDKYTRELTIMARSISEYKPVFRKDNAPVKRVELHLHTNMSAQDGLTRPGDLVKQLVKWGHDAVAITDHGTAQAYPDMFNSMKKATKKGEPDALKLIYGCECYLCDRTPDMTD